MWLAPDCKVGQGRPRAAMAGCSGHCLAMFSSMHLHGCRSMHLHGCRSMRLLEGALMGGGRACRGLVQQGAVQHRGRAGQRRQVLQWSLGG